ncbi:hypothetical protein LPJ81_003437, partial [Coemansia sp. IMI 209127]
DLQGKDDEIARLQQTIDTRDKELRHLRRASRKALDQLADIKTTQEQQQQQQHNPPQMPPRNDSIVGSSRQQGLESELQEAAAVHVRLQFEIAHLESEISRLEDEKTQLARDLGRRDKRILGLEKRLRSSEEASEGIRVRAMDDGAAADDDDASKKFGSIGTKSHKRFKVQLQNMQKHIEYLETKLALSVSENDELKKQQQQKKNPEQKSSQQQQGHGIRFPGFARNNSSNSVGSRSSSGSGKARVSSSIFPNLPSNLDMFGKSATSLNAVDESLNSTAGVNSTNGGTADGSVNGNANGSNGSNGTRPRNDSLTSSFERIRSPFKSFRRQFT